MNQTVIGVIERKKDVKFLVYDANCYNPLPLYKVNKPMNRFHHIFEVVFGCIIPERSTGRFLYGLDPLMMNDFCRPPAPYIELLSHDCLFLIIAGGFRDGGV